jgi:hypothetical protein
MLRAPLQLTNDTCSGHTAGICRAPTFDLPRGTIAFVSGARQWRAFALRSGSSPRARVRTNALATFRSVPIEERPRQLGQRDDCIWRRAPTGSRAEALLSTCGEPRRSSLGRPPMRGRQAPVADAHRSADGSAPPATSRQRARRARVRVSQPNAHCDARNFITTDPCSVSHFATSYGERCR